MHKVSTSAGPVSVRVEGPRHAPAFFLAHGAGAGMDHSFMEAAASGLAERDVRTWLFNFVYTEVGRKAPDRGPVLEATYRDVIGWVREHEAPGNVFLGGKSMGGRVAAQIAAAGEPCDGLVFLGYPLHPPGRPDRLRDAPLRDAAVPMLFVEGDRDPFCPLETLERVRSELPSETEVFVVKDGDHSFRVRKSSGRTSVAALDEALDRVAAWIRGRSERG